MRLWGVMYYRLAQDRTRARTHLGVVYRCVTSLCPGHARYAYSRHVLTAEAGGGYAGGAVGTVGSADGHATGATDLDTSRAPVRRNWTYSGP